MLVGNKGSSNSSNNEFKLALMQDECMSTGRLQKIQSNLKKAYTNVELHLKYDTKVTHVLVDIGSFNYNKLNEFCGGSIEKPYPFKLLTLEWLFEWCKKSEVYNYESRPDCRRYMIQDADDGSDDDDDDNYDDIRDDDDDSDTNFGDGNDSDDEGANENIVSVFQQLHEILRLSESKATDFFRAR